MWAHASFLVDLYVSGEAKMPHRVRPETIRKAGFDQDCSDTMNHFFHLPFNNTIRLGLTRHRSIMTKAELPKCGFDCGTIVGINVFNLLQRSDEL